MTEKSCVDTIHSKTRNVGQCQTWWSPCRIYVAPSVQRRKVWLTPTSRCRVVTLPRRNLLKFAGVPQTGQPISATSTPKFTILWGHVEDILLLNEFFPIVDTCLSCEDIARQSCAMVPRWRFLATFLRPVFSTSLVQQVSDLHLKFALRPHHVWKYGRPNLRRLRLGEEKKNKPQHENIYGLPYYIGRP